MFRHRRLDGVWTQVDVSLMPWVVAGNAFQPVPILYTLDSTPRLLRGLGRHYEVAVTRSPMKRAVKDAVMRAFYRHVTLFNPWSEWAARSLRADYGVPESRIEVRPPGVDIGRWRPAESRRKSGPIRLLFVGGDFERKGGDLLLDVYRNTLAGKVEIDLVTKAGLGDHGPHVRVHTGLSANDRRLVELYQQADIFVLPSRADCFSMAGMEAMASGLPVIICPVGGIAGMFEYGREGLYIEPDNGADLARAIHTLVDDPVRRRAMGANARALAEKRYDASANTKSLLERFLGLSGRLAVLDQGEGGSSVANRVAHPAPVLEVEGDAASPVA